MSSLLLPGVGQPFTALHLVRESKKQQLLCAAHRVANDGPSPSPGGSLQSRASDGKAGPVHEGRVRELAAVREAREQGLDEAGCNRLQGVRVQPYFVAGDMSSWLVPRHFLLHNNPMEFAAKLDDCPCFQDPEVQSQYLNLCLHILVAALHSIYHTQSHA